MYLKKIAATFNLVFIIASFDAIGQHFTAAAVTEAGIVTSISEGDYDNDSYVDLLIVNPYDYTHALKLLRLNNGMFEPVKDTGLPNRADDAQWIDYDKDGDLDVSVTLYDTPRSFVTIYLNNNGMFVRLDNNLPTDIREANYSWGDYDNDGDADVTICGGKNSEFVHIFSNDDGEFVPVEIGKLSSSATSFTWVDFDGDEDLDFYLSFVSGTNGGVLYENTGEGFVPVVSTFPGLPYSQTQWADFDNDGDKDLLLKAIYDYRSSNYTAVFENKGNNIFEKLTTLNITAASGGTTRWIDFDNDGDLDIFHSGYPLDTPEIYVRQGSTYTKKTNLGLPQTGVLPVGLVDYDHDNDIDVVGQNGYWYLLRTYRNDGASNPIPLNNVPAWAEFVSATPLTTTSIRFVFFDFADDEVNWSIEIQPGAAAVFEPLATVTGKPDYWPNSYDATSLTAGIQYGFRIRSQNANGYSRYSDVVYSYTANPDFPRTTIAGQYLTTQEHSLVDLDKDGDLDLAFLGSTDPTMQMTEIVILRNDGGAFVKQNHNIPNLVASGFDWADYDNDGDQDLLLTGYPGQWTPALKVMVNKGGFVFEDLFALTGENFEGYLNGNAKWLDVNNDGKLDFYISGQANFDNAPFVSSVFLGSGVPGSSFFKQPSMGLPTLAGGDIACADFNNDGYVDVAMAGGISDFVSDGSQHVNINMNQGGAGFITSQVFDVGRNARVIRTGDFDSDGDADLIVGGHDFPPVIHWNDNGVFRKDEENIFETLLNQALGVGDFDNDGDIDLLIAGFKEGTPLNRIYLNNGDRKFLPSNIALSPTQNNTYAVGDFDNDRDIDFIEAGYLYTAEDQNVKTYSVKNNTTPLNDLPTAPTITKIEQKVDGLVVEWQNGTDRSATLTSNLYIKDPGNTYRFNAISDNLSGHVRVPSAGNMSYSHKTFIKDLFVGEVELGVQNIDNSFIGSAFGKKTFTIEALQPQQITVDTSACEGDKKELSVAGQYIQWFKEADKEQLIAGGNSVQFDINTNDTTFYASQLYFTDASVGMIAGPTLPINVKVYHYVREKIERSENGLLAPIGTAYQWIRNDTILVEESHREITTSLPGHYRIKISSGPCVSDTISYVIRPKPPQLTYDDEVCLTESQTVTAVGEFIEWFKGDGAEIASGSNSITITPLLTDSVLFATQTVNLAQSEKSKARWTTYSYPSPDISDVGGVITAGAATEYQWYFNGEPVEGATTNELPYSAEGAYYVELRNGSCVTKSKVFTYTGLLDKDRFVGISYDKITENLFIESDNAQPIEAIVFDATGRTILNVQRANNYLQSISLSGISAGVYIVHVRLNDNSIYRKKFLK